MSHSDRLEPTAVKQVHSPISCIEHGFETLVFASRWIQSPTLRRLDRGRAAIQVQISRQTVEDDPAHQSAIRNQLHARRPRDDRRHDGDHRRLRHLREQI